MTLPLIFSAHVSPQFFSRAGIGLISPKIVERRGRLLSSLYGNHTKSQTSGNFLVGADPCVRP
jgi:hypothetical protein